jgi:hypothetical protein
MANYIISGTNDDYVNGALKELRLEVAPTRTIVSVGGKAKSEWLAERKGLPFSAEQLNPEATGVWNCDGKTCRKVTMGFEEPSSEAGTLAAKTAEE